MIPKLHRAQNLLHKNFIFWKKFFIPLLFLFNVFGKITFSTWNMFIPLLVWTKVYHHQFNASSSPQIWGEVRGEILFSENSSILKQLLCTSWLWDGPWGKVAWARWPHCYSSLFQLQPIQWGKLQSFMETENMPHLDGGEVGLCREESPTLVPDWSVLMQMRTWNPYSLVQKAQCWLVGMELLWLVNKDINEAIAEKESLIGQISNLGALL